MNYLKENDTKFIYRFGSAEDNDPLDYKLLDQIYNCDIYNYNGMLNKHLVFQKDDVNIAFYEYENLDNF